MGWILAEADSVPVGAMISIIGAIFTGLGTLLGVVLQKHRQKGNVKIEEPVPEVPVRKAFPPPSWHQFEGLTRRVDHVEKEVHEIWEDQKRQFTQILQAGADREMRIRDKIDSAARETHQRIDDFMREQKGGRQ